MTNATVTINGVHREIVQIAGTVNGVYREVTAIPATVNGVYREGYTAFDPYIVKNASSTQNTSLATIPKTRIQEAIDNGCTIIKLTAYKAAEGNYNYFMLRKENSSSPYYGFTGDNITYQYVGNIEHTVSITSLDADVTTWEIWNQSTTFTNVYAYFE